MAVREKGSEGEAHREAAAQFLHVHCAHHQLRGPPNPALDIMRPSTATLVTICTTQSWQWFALNARIDSRNRVSFNYLEVIEHY